MTKLLEEAFVLAHQLSERDQYFFARFLLSELLGESNISGMHGPDVPEFGDPRPSGDAASRVADGTTAYRRAGSGLVIETAADIPDPKELGDPSDEELKDTPALMAETRRHAFALADDQQEMFAAFMHREAIGELKWAELFARPESDILLEQLADEALEHYRAGRTRPLSLDDF